MATQRNRARDQDADAEVIVLAVTPGASRDVAWRAHAVKLASRRGLIGQAQQTPSGVPSQAFTSYQCVSAREAADHQLFYYARTGEIWCDCVAASFGNPCAHAGATLLLIAHLAPERTRTPEGEAPHGAS